MPDRAADTVRSDRHPHAAKDRCVFGCCELAEALSRCVGTGSDEPIPDADYVRAYEAFEALAVRLWCDDRPAVSSLTEIDAWAAGLPEDECAALNAMLGETFSHRLGWDGDHPISQVVFAHNDDGEGGA